MPTFRSHAKINLHLEVVGRRSDGYHELRTVFQTLDLADEIEVERRAKAGIEIAIEGAPGLPRDRTNLAVRAAEAFLERWGSGSDGVRLALRKRVPMGAGLGGGSANAATTLLALAAEWGVDEGAPEIAEIGRSLGADVPFCLVGGLAFGAGRGDEIRALDDPLEPLDLWIALPPWPVPTAGVFAALAGPGPPPDARIAALLERRSAAPLAEWIGRNDLEEPAFRLRPELGAMYTSLVRAGARAVRMSGSGSTLFAIFSDPVAARAAGVGLPSGTRWLPARALGRRAWRASSGFAAIEGGR
jgi:4-diphosphocytidyl-2-C-methyl-D-erythritol kinase